MLCDGPDLGINHNPTIQSFEIVNLFANVIHEYLILKLGETRLVIML